MKTSDNDNTNYFCHCTEIIILYLYQRTGNSIQMKEKFERFNFTKACDGTVYVCAG